MRPYPELNLYYEEADALILHHVVHLLKCGFQNILVLSGDTDVLVILLHFFFVLQEMGLKELWVKSGIRESVRHIPVHTLASKLGKELCEVIPAVHVLTGSDYTSKCGTKHASLAANPVQYLSGFGKTCSKDELDIQVKQAELYLIKVLKKGCQCQSMNELRSMMYHHAKISSFTKLPPTSSVIRGHILISFFVTNVIRTLLSKSHFQLDPKDYGYYEDDNMLLPCVSENHLPYEFVLFCNCLKCATTKCKCRQRGVECCRFCQCQNHAGDSCRNQY